MKSNTASRDENLTTNVDLEAIENIVHCDWEWIDPTPDVSAWAKKFNKYFFENILSGVEVYWSKKMTSCAGITYKKNDSIVIRLSEPVLKFVSRKDIIESLLVSIESDFNDELRLNVDLQLFLSVQHEMIHAYLFAKNLPSHHNKLFKQIMNDINDRTGTNITIIHHFNQNTEIYFFRCNGKCRSQPPDFGWVKTDTTRAPHPKWNGHHKKCDGRFYRVYDTHKAVSNSPQRKTSSYSSLNDLDALTGVDNNHKTVSNHYNVEHSRTDPSLMHAAEPKELNRRNAIDISMGIKKEISHETGGEFYEIDLITDLDALPTDEMFANYNEYQQKLLSVQFLVHVEPDSLHDKNFCIVCHHFVADEQIYQHLFECTGLSAEQIQYELPFYRIPSTKEY